MNFVQKLTKVKGQIIVVNAFLGAVIHKICQFVLIKESGLAGKYNYVAWILCKEILSKCL